MKTTNSNFKISPRITQVNTSHKYQFDKKIKRTGEGTLAAGNNNGSNVLVVIEILEDLVQLNKETVTEGVQGLGAVKSDKGDASTGLSQQVLKLGRSRGNSVYCFIWLSVNGDKECG